MHIVRGNSYSILYILHTLIYMQVATSKLQGCCAIIYEHQGTSTYCHVLVDLSRYQSLYQVALGLDPNIHVKGGGTELQKITLRLGLTKYISGYLSIYGNGHFYILGIR